MGPLLNLKFEQEPITNKNSPSTPKKIHFSCHLNSMGFIYRNCGEDENWNNKGYYTFLCAFS